MATALILCGLVGAFYAVIGYVNGTSAVHEIETLIGVLIVTVALGSGFVVANQPRR